MKVYSIFSGSASIAAALLTSSLLFSTRTLSAETLSSPETPQTQQIATKTTAEATAPVDVELPSNGDIGERIASEETYVVAPASYVATAYSLRGRTATGQMVSKGIIAADPRFLPLGSRVRLQAGTYSGEYVVADTGSMVRGRRIDIWTPTSREAMRFGRRLVKLTVLSLPGRRRAAHAVK